MPPGSRARPRRAPPRCRSSRSSDRARFRRRPRGCPDRRRESGSRRRLRGSPPPARARVRRPPRRRRALREEVRALLLRGRLAAGRRRLGRLVADYLTTRVGAARRADPVRQAQAVTARALVQPRRRDLVLGAPLVAPRPRLSLLGDRHAGGMVAAARRTSRIARCRAYPGTFVLSSLS